MPSNSCLTALLNNSISVTQRNGYLGLLSEGSDLRAALNLKRLLVTRSIRSSGRAPRRDKLLIIKLSV